MHERASADRRRIAERRELAVHDWSVRDSLPRRSVCSASVVVIAPLFEFAAFGRHGAIYAALAIGIAFGWCLERAGMGSARKLAGQFYLTDLTVFKVMFSAIVTAMLGAFWLGRIGVLDLSRVYVPETFILPQLVGGLVFGVGFAVGGLCPGTSCVAAATGRGDGFMLLSGMFTGVLVTGLAFSKLEHF